jgi:hypothetical protein
VAIALRVAGSPTAAAATITTVNPAVGSGATTGDLSVLLLTGKPYNTTGMETGNLSTWTQLGTFTANGTTGSGTDSGSMGCTAFVKESASVGSVGNLTLTGGNSFTAVILTFSKAADKAWDYLTFTFGSDNTSGANLSCTGSAWNTASGDMIVCVAGIPSDADTVTASALSGMSGSTIGTQTIDVQQNTSMGQDSHMSVVHAAITAGSSSAAPVYTHTDATSRTGQAMFIRLREADVYTGPSTDLAVTAALSSDARARPYTTMLADGIVT